MYPNIFLFLLLFFIPFIEYLSDSFFSFIVVKVVILSLTSSTSFSLGFIIWSEGKRVSEIGLHKRLVRYEDKGWTQLFDFQNKISQGTRMVSDFS
jgi:hypothetical protein